jgi:sarcosine oxidase subunit gamma
MGQNKMREPATPLSGALFDGAIRVAEAPITGMVTIRGDLGDDGVRQAVTATTGIAIPGQRRILTKGAHGLAWMSPDELLLMLPNRDAPGMVDRLTAALAGQHHLVADVSAARAMFDLTGAGWREVLAKGAPVDLAAVAFKPGDFRRTRLGQVAVAFWATDDSTAHLICFRSVAGFVFDWLTVAAAEHSLPGILR